MIKKLNKAQGTIGEINVAGFLQKKKYKILQSNYKTKFGEIDIICQYKGIIVFVEVKKRETLAFGRPSETVNKQKQAKIRRVAEEFLVRNHLLEQQVRFDVVEVLGEEINHIESCF